MCGTFFATYPPGGSCTRQNNRSTSCLQESRGAACDVSNLLKSQSGKYAAWSVTRGWVSLNTINQALYKEPFGGAVVDFYFYFNVFQRDTFTYKLSTENVTKKRRQQSGESIKTDPPPTNAAFNVRL